MGIHPINPPIAKSIASGLKFFPRPHSIKYIGPPCSIPSSSCLRYRQESVHVKNLIIMPNRPATHIQNIAPAPPILIAIATPAIFPIPIVPESATVNA